MNTFRLTNTVRLATMLKREQNAATFKVAFDNGFYPVTWCPKAHVYWLYAIGLDASTGDGGETWIDIDGDVVPVEDVRGLVECRDLLFVDGPQHGFAQPLYQ